MSPEWLVQQAKANAKEKSFMVFSSIKWHNKFLWQIPLSPLFFHERSTTFQIDKEDAHRFLFSITSSSNSRLSSDCSVLHSQFWWHQKWHQLVRNFFLHFLASCLQCFTVYDTVDTNNFGCDLLYGRNNAISNTDHRPCTVCGHSLALQPRHTVFWKVIGQFREDAGCSGVYASRKIKQIGLMIDDFHAFLVRKANICNQLSLPR